MQKLIFIILLTTMLSCTNDDSSKDTQSIFVGDVHFSTQSELESFGSNNYSEIMGDLFIGSANFGNEITSLELLSSLKKVNNLYISVDDLVNLNGLHNLSVVNGNFHIRSINHSMDNFVGLNSLKEINGDFTIVRSYFKNLVGLENLNIISGNLNMSSCYELRSLSGFLLSTIGGNFEIINCDLLTNLTGIESLIVINGNLSIYDNDNLTSLYGLQNLSESNDVIIGGETLSGLEASNVLLSDLCDLKNLFANGTFGEVIITNNLYNPTPDDIINNNCRQ